AWRRRRWLTSWWTRRKRCRWSGTSPRANVAGSRSTCRSDWWRPLVAEPVGVSLLGAGNIGSAVVAALAAGAERYAARVGRPLALRRVLVRDTSRARPGVEPSQVTGDIDDVLRDEGTHIVVEIMGGEEPARTYME